MAREVIWTPRAREGVEEICAYLDLEWGDTVREAFLDEVDLIVGIIRRFPLMARSSGIHDVREALVTKHNLLFYRLIGDRIFLLEFWDTRRDPSTKPRFT